MYHTQDVLNERESGQTVINFLREFLQKDVKTENSIILH